MRLLRVPDHSITRTFLYEVKHDGFRALAHVEGHQCRLVSRNGHVFRRWPQLAEELAHALRCWSAVIDGEICCLEPDGRSNFYRLMFRRDWPHFYAFDALAIDGEDLTRLPCLSASGVSSPSCRMLSLGCCTPTRFRGAERTCTG